MRDKVIEIIKTMCRQVALEAALGQERCAFYLRDYADQLAAAIEYTEDGQ